MCSWQLGPSTNPRFRIRDQPKDDKTNHFSEVFRDTGNFLQNLRKTVGNLDVDQDEIRDWIFSPKTIKHQNKIQWNIFQQIGYHQRTTWWSLWASDLSAWWYLGLRRWPKGTELRTEGSQNACSRNRHKQTTQKQVFRQLHRIRLHVNWVCNNYHTLCKVRWRVTWKD